MICDVDIWHCRMSASNTKIQMSNPHLKMNFHPLIWLILQLCLIMQSQLVQAIIGSSFNHQCPEQCLCLSQIQVSWILINIYNDVEYEDLSGNFPTKNHVSGWIEMVILYICLSAILCLSNKFVSCYYVQTTKHIGYCSTIYLSVSK